MRVGVVRVAAPTSTGTVDFTVTGGGTCKGAIFFLSRATADNTASDIAAWGWGATDGTRNRALSAVSHHNQPSTVTRRRGLTDKCLALITTTGAIDGEAHFDSFITDGVRLNVTDAFTSGWLVVARLFFDDGDLSVHVDSLDTTSGNDDVTEPGFEPTFVELASIRGALDDTSRNGAAFSLGWAINDGATPPTQCSFNFWEGNTQTDGAPTARVESALALRHVQNATVGGAIEIDSFDASGFTAEQVDALGYPCAYVAIKCDNVVALDVYSSPTSTGAANHTLAGFEPVAVFGFLSKITSAGSNDQTDRAGSWGAFAFTSTSVEYSASIQCEDASPSTDTQSFADSIFCHLPDDDGGTAGDLQASVTALLSTGWEGTWTAVDASACLFAGLAIEALAAPVEVTPTPAVLEVAAPPPAVDAPVAVGPTPAALELVAPAAAVDAPVAVAPAPAALELAAPAAAVDAPVHVAPTPAVLALDAPAAAVDAPVAVAPLPAVLELVAPAAGVTSAAGADPTPAVLELVAPAPAVDAPVHVSPSPAVLELVAPSAEASSAAGASPTPAVLQLVAPAAAVDAPVHVTPTPAVLQLVAPPTQSGVVVTPSPAVLRLRAPKTWRLEGPALPATLTAMTALSEVLAAPAALDAKLTAPAALEVKLALVQG